MVDTKHTESMIASRLQALHKELEKREPALVQEIRFLENLLKASGPKPSIPYSEVDSLLMAITLCIHAAGDFKLTKREIIAEIMDGGFRKSTQVVAARPLNDTLNKQIEKGALALKGDLVGRNPSAKKKW